MPVTAHRRPPVTTFPTPLEGSTPDDLPDLAVEPDPPAIVPVSPFQPVYPMPTVGSDQAIEAYTAARRPVGLIEHQAQLAMMLGLIKAAVRDTLVPHLLLDALPRADRFNELYAIYGQRIAKIARCLNVEFIVPVPPEVPEFVRFLACDDNSGIVSQTALAKRVAAASVRVTECERAKRVVANAFSSQSDLEWAGRYRPHEVLDLKRYVSITTRGSLAQSVIVRPPCHEWAPDAAIRRYDEAVVEHQRALDHQAVLRREYHRADDLTLTTARRAIDEHGGVEGITAAVVDALRIAGRFYEQSSQWDDIVKRRATIGRIEAAISGLPDNSKFVASQRDDLRTLRFAVEDFIEAADRERIPQVRADVERAYNGDQDAIASLLTIASAAPAGLFGDGFVHALKLCDFTYAFRHAVNTSLILS